MFELNILTFKNTMSMITLGFNYLLKPIMQAIPYVSALIGLHMNAYVAIKAAIFEQGTPTSRALQSIGALIRMVISILRLFVAIPLVGILLSIITSVELAIDVAIAIYQRIIPYIENENEKIKANSIIAEKSHLLVLAAISLASAVLFALTFNIIGGIVLVAVMAYSVLDALDKNPLRWLGNKIFNHPFAEKPVPVAEKLTHVNDKRYINAVSVPLKNIYLQLGIKPIAKNDKCFDAINTPPTPTENGTLLNDQTMHPVYTKKSERILCFK